jgi:YVTN family beta-propeller protein
LQSSSTFVRAARIICLVLCLAAPAAAGAAGSGVRIYLQPLPSDAARLTFSIASLSVIGAGGAEIAVPLNRAAADVVGAGRQRLLASGPLPPGRYEGLRIAVERASMTDQRGNIALATPEAPLRIDLSFSVAADRTPLIWLSLQAPVATRDGMAFDPRFRASIPPPAMPDRSGFISNAGSNTITVFDKGLAQAVAAINTCDGPAGMAVDQRRRRVYVACPADDELQAIDAAAGDVIQRARLTPGDQPQEVALTPDGATLVSANTGSNTLTFFDAASLARLDRVDVGSSPVSVAIDPAGRRAFAFDARSNSLSIVDIASRRLVATLSMDAAPLRGQFSATGDRLYVIQERSPYLLVLDPALATITGRVRLGTAASAIAVDQVRGLICLASAADPIIEFYDPHALLPLFSMQARAGLSHLLVDAASNRLYALDREAGGLLVVGLADRKVVSEIDAGPRPYGVAVAGEK